MKLRVGYVNRAFIALFSSFVLPTSSCFTLSQHYWVFSTLLFPVATEKTAALGATMPEKQRDWKLKKDTEELHTHCLISVFLQYVQLSHAHQQCFLFLFTSLQQLEADGRWTHRNKVTGRQTSRLSSYLCTPSGSQQQIHWCLTGRSGTDCWMCCSVAGGLLYLYFKIYRKRHSACQRAH